MSDIQIGGLVSFTTIDYPGNLAAVLFLVGCPLRCAYCSNPHLLSFRSGDYDPIKVFEWIRSRVGKLEAIVFSGGEALMQSDALIQYMQQVRQLGFKIGLHTNGFYPENLTRAAPFVDWIGLDYKATREKYPDLTGQNIAYNRMINSLNIWHSTGKDYEIRVTCDPRFISPNDLLTIANDCATRGVKNFAIQKYIPHFETDTDNTTSADREQFFTHDIKNTINTMFENVIWRE